MFQTVELGEYDLMQKPVPGEGKWLSLSHGQPAALLG